MGKLHELLAVEKDAREVFSKILEETLKTFNQRSGHFAETRRTYSPLNVEDKDCPDEEFTAMVTTVKDKLDYTQDSIVRFVDIELQKERANQKASANVIVELPDGKTETILENAPVTFLVQMESLLDRVRKIYQNIPTFDPAKEWVVDETRDNVWKSDPITKIRTKKMPEVIIKVEATEKFQGQSEIIMMDKPVGTFSQTSSSGALSPKQKSQILARIDRLIAGIKIARSKANVQETDNDKIGMKLFNYINQGFKLN